MKKKPSPGGRGLERTSAKRSFLRERVRDDCHGAASPLPPPDPHPALRATFSQREKDQRESTITSSASAFAVIVISVSSLMAAPSRAFRGTPLTSTAPTAGTR